MAKASVSVRPQSPCHNGSSDMSDLDDDLLALAGGDASASESEDDYQPAPAIARKGGAADAAESDDDEDEEDDDGNDIEDEDEPALVNPYPLEGKYTDASDKARLEAMDEIQREQIIFDRSQEMELFKEKQYLQQRATQEKRQKSEGTATRTSGRTKGNEAKSNKLDKLSELRKQRERKHKKHSENEDYVAESEQDEDVDMIDEDAEDDQADGYYSDEEPVKWGGASRSTGRKSLEPASVANINAVLLGRTVLAQYCYHSEFNDMAVDCYGKVNLGMDRRNRQPMYRLVKIIDVKSIPQRAYTIENSKCDIFLVVSQNRKQTKEFPITVFSDSPIGNDEYQRYVAELAKTEERIDYASDVTQKGELLQQFISRGLSDHDVNQIIERKKQARQAQSTKGETTMAGYDAVFQKSRLMDELKVCRQQPSMQSKVPGIIEELKRLDRIMAGLNEAADSSKPLNSMNKVNERNRKLNSTNIRRAELKTKNSAVAADDGDPFLRLKTNTRMFYQDIINQENEKALNDAKRSYHDLLEEKTVKEAKIAQLTYRVLGQMDKLILEIDIDMGIEV